MLNKKSLALSSFVRLILAFLFLYVIIGCGTNLYAGIIGSKAPGSFDDLVIFIGELEYDYPLPYNLYLDNEDAIIAFTKDSEKIEFAGIDKQVRNRHKSYFTRPGSCEKDKACLCLCKKFKLDKEEEIICSSKQEIECKPLENINFKEEINESELGATIFFAEYTFKNGFFLKKIKLSEKDKKPSPAEVNYGLIETITPIPAVDYYPVNLYIKKDRDNIVYINTEPCDFS